MRVLIIGHACSPRLGSEPGFTWNWAFHLSRFHQVWVLAHPHDRCLVEQLLDNHQNKNLRFHWLNVPRFLDAWGSKGAGHDRGLRLHYLIWLRLAYEKVIELHQQIGFDVVHHVSYGSVSAPPPVRKLDIPLVWGPIGGGQHTPWSFRQYFGWAWPRELARSARVRLLRFSPSARSAAKSSLVTLATNQETANLLRQMGARDVRLCLDSGIPSSFVSDALPSPRNGEPFTLLWAGRMQPRKALPLALEALVQADDVPVRLLIAGDGEMRNSWEEFVKRWRLERNAEFLGRVPWSEMPGVYQRADAFLFTSLRDSFGTQVLEAMGQGLPILTLDHQGAGTFVPPSAGIKIPVTTPRETVLRIAEGIRWLAQNPGERRRMGEAGRAFARTQTWEKRAEWMSKLYEEVSRTRVSDRLGGPAAYGSYGVRKRIEKIDEMLDLEGKHVLDLGCGNGCYTAELARRAASVCGVDIQRPHLKAFQQPIPRVQAAGENLPFASESFDVVTMIEVLEHTRNEERVLKECFRVLKPGGFAVLFVPNKLYPFESHPCHIRHFSMGRNIPLISWFPDSLRKRLCHARIYTRRKLLSLAKSAGFQTRGSGCIFPPLDSFPLPCKDFYRRAARRLEKTPAAKFGVSLYAILQKPTLKEAPERIVASDVLLESISFEVLGVRVHAAQLQNAVARMEKWIHDRDRCHTIAPTSMHGIVEAQHDPSFKEILNSTDVVAPDGMPLVWLGRRRGHPLPRRVYGPDLMLDFCEKTAGRGYRHFFYGGEPGVPERLAESLKRRFPSLEVCGTFSPPFRPLHPEEDKEIVSMISRAAPDVLWVGLGTPKQERWMHEHRDQLHVPVLVSVGAAFDILSGQRNQAPRLMREHGLEWLFRLVQEPRRLWRRYLVYGAQFIAYLSLESLRLKDSGGGQRLNTQSGGRGDLSGAEGVPTAQITFR
jgi:exopolysaccharide biosynthesis WecB/TagA/CpsF family protein